MRPALLPVLFLALVVAPWFALADVVDDFIARAEAAAQPELGSMVSEHGVLVGAAVGALLDGAFDASPDLGRSRVTLARRIAELHKELDGSDIPLSIVETFESWTPAQRDVRSEAIALEKEAGVARDLGGYERAAELFEEARALYEQIGDRRSVAVNHGSLGVVYWRMNDMGKVYQHYEKALEARRAVEDRILEGKTLNGLGSANYRVGNYQGAIDWYRRAVELRERTGDRGGLGTSLTYLGNAYYNLGQLPEAREQYQKAIAVLDGIGSPAQSFNVLNGMGSVSADLGRMSASNDAFERAIEIAEGEGLWEHELTARRNLADNMRRSHRFREALEQFDAIETILAGHPDANSQAMLHRDRGVTQMNMGELDDAREDLLAFLKQAEELNNPAYRTEAMINVGYLYRELGAFDRAIEMARKAHELAAGNRRSQRLALALAGASEQAAGDYESALRDWQAALALDLKEGAEHGVAMDKASIATVKAAMGRTSEARRDFYALLPAARADGMRLVEWSVHFGIGHTFEGENPDSAVAHYEAALALIERAGSMIGGDELQTEYLSGRRRFYYEEVARYYASRDAGEGGDWSQRAFHTMERAKARGLARLLRASVAGQSSPAEEDVLDQLYALDASSKNHSDRRRELEQRYTELRAARVEDTFGGLGGAGVTADIDALREALPANTVLLEYALGDTTSLLWVIDRKGHDLVQVPPRARLEQEVERLRGALARPGTGDRVVRQTARALYETLIAPAGKRLKKASDVVIVPDGVLFELPFEMLLSSTPEDDANWSELSFLARELTTTYVPSATVYLSLDTDASQYTTELLAVGNPDFSGLRRPHSAPLAALPHAENEVRDISAHVTGDRCRTLLGSDASESALKRHLESDAPRVLHLATHGLVDPLEPTRSSVALAADSAGNDDGYLYTLEILSLPSAGVVVMSACESARGKVSRGEGVVGLSRAFIAAGARGVVASLWAVSDESTAMLMKEFYRHMMGEKLTAGRALNQARLALIDSDDFAHPFYWSPFVVIGAGSAPW